MARPKSTSRPVKKRVVTPKVTKPEAGQEEIIQAAEPEVTPPAEVNKKVKQRVPVGMRDPLKTGGLDPNYQYRHVRGNPDRLQMFLDGGYEFVEDEQAIADAGIIKASKMGSRISSPSGDSSDRLFLMRIQRELYEQDQKLKQQKVDALEDNLKPDAEKAGLGVEGSKIDITR